MTLKSSDRPSEDTPTPWVPEPLPKAKAMSMEQDEVLRQAGIDHYYDHCHKVMEIILEDIIDYSEFKAMEPELEKDELDKIYFNLFDKWDIVCAFIFYINGNELTSRQLKHIMLRFVKIDAELGCLDVLISFGKSSTALALGFLASTTSLTLYRKVTIDHRRRLWCQNPS